MDFLTALSGLFGGNQPYAQRATPMSSQRTPAERDFPGRTNYGVPQDNMIDTPNGYVTPAQYNLMRHPRPQGIPMQEPRLTGIPMGQNPNIQNRNVSPTQPIPFPGTMGLQGGPVNTGRVPLQNSGFNTYGPGYGRGMQGGVNPQIKDRGPFLFE